MDLGRWFAAVSFAALLLVGPQSDSAAARKVHTVFLGVAKRVPYSKAGAPPERLRAKAC